MDTPETSWKQTLAYLAAWLTSTVLAIVDLWIVGSAVMQATLWYGAHRSEASRRQELLTGGSFGWTAEAVGQITLLLLVCVGLGLTIWLEYHYRTGVDKGKLRQRFVRVTRNQMVVAIVGLAVIILRSSSRHTCLSTMECLPHVTEYDQHVIAASAARH